MIEELIRFIPEELYELSFQELNQRASWIELPVLLKKEFLSRNYDSYSKNNQTMVLEWLRNENLSHNSNDPKEKVSRIIEFIDFAVENIPYQYASMKIALLTKFKESKLKDFILNENIDLIVPVYKYIDSKIEIIQIQKENIVFDERDLEKESKITYQKLRDSFFYNYTFLYNMLDSKEVNITEELINSFLVVYLEIPNLELSNVEYFETYSLGQIKKFFKEITSRKRISIKTLSYLMLKLETSIVILKKMKENAEIQLVDINPKRYYTKSRIQMMIHFHAKRIMLMNQFMNYIERNYINSRSTILLPRTFEETISNPNTFKKILADLKDKKFISEFDGNYKWETVAPELVSFLEKLHEIKMLKYPINRKYTDYGKLLNVFFNRNYSNRSYQPSSNSTKNNLFKFLNIYNTNI